MRRETVWRTLIAERGYDMSDPPNWGKGTTSVTLKFKLLKIIAIRVRVLRRRPVSGAQPRRSQPVLAPPSSAPLPKTV